MSGINIRDYLHEPEQVDSKSECQFSQTQKDEILEAFTLYDKDGDGLISTRDLGTVMRAIGQVPTICEETDIIAQYEQEKCYEIDFIAFLKLVMTRYRTFDEEDELMEAFRRFDKEENGFVGSDELRNMLITIGEPLTEQEVDIWLEDAQEFTKEGKLFYENFATFMLSK